MLLWKNREIIICRANRGKEMPNTNILFDDWQTRCDGVLKQRRRAYTFSLISVSILFLASLVGVFFELAIIAPLVISLIALIVVLLEWLKLKDNHLVMKSNQIEITNRFNKTTIYKIHIHELTLDLRHSFNHRSGGIIMEFHDSKGNQICKYEDMLNRTAPWGFEKTSWERSLQGLGIKITDAGGIFKN